MITKVAGKKIENIEELNLPQGPAVDFNHRMALESSDFQMDTGVGVAYFAIGADSQNQTMLTVWFDPGWADMFRLNLYQGCDERGPHLSTRDVDGNTVGRQVKTGFAVAYFDAIEGDDVKYPKPKSAIVHKMHYDRLAKTIWEAFHTGEFEYIDHEAWGVRRLTEDEIQAKIDEAKAKKEARTAQAAEAQPAGITVVDGGAQEAPAPSDEEDPTTWS